MKTCFKNKVVSRYFIAIISFSSFRRLRSVVEVVRGKYVESIILLCHIFFSNPKYDTANYIFAKYLNASCNSVDLTKDMTPIFMCTDWPVARLRIHTVGIIQQRTRACLAKMILPIRYCVLVCPINE